MIDETVEEIEQMQTHSSSVVAVKAAMALRELLDREFSSLAEYERALERNAGALRRANPSHASLHNAMGEIVDRTVDGATSVEEAKQLTRDAIEHTIERVESGKRRAAEAAAETFVDGETLLLHDYSSTVLEAVETAVEDGIALTIYVTEARPRYLGRKTARRLADIDGVEPHLIVDSASGHFLPECDRVMIGMDCIVGDTLYNRVGTYPLAATADHVGVPVVVVGSAAKLIDDEFVFENEVRPPSEVMREPAEGFAIENPAYDATPTELLAEVVTGDDAQRP